QFDAARREAALLGLNAGPGQVFPYIQRYERVRTGDNSQSGGTQHAAGQPYVAPGAMPADSRSAVPAGQFQQGSPQQGSPQQAGPQQQPQPSQPPQWQHQQQPSQQWQWQQQTMTEGPHGGSVQPSGPSSDERHQPWG